jgi:hypothetical protein
VPAIPKKSLHINKSNLAYCPNLAASLHAQLLCLTFLFLPPIKVSQQTRLGVTKLVERLRPSLGKKVGLRLGGGIKDESEDALIHFVTSGYLVKLIGHFPDALRDHTHLIIDDVHERSIEGDLILMLVRDLMVSNRRLHVILMTATPHVEVYLSYFKSSCPQGLQPLLVGSIQPFKREVKYADDLGFQELLEATEKSEATGRQQVTTCSRRDRRWKSLAGFGDLSGEGSM